MTVIAMTRTYLERYGKPVAFYSDKHGVFRVNRKVLTSGHNRFLQVRRGSHVSSELIEQVRRSKTQLAVFRTKPFLAMLELDIGVNSASGSVHRQCSGASKCEPDRHQTPRPLRHCIAGWGRPSHRDARSGITSARTRAGEAVLH